MMRVVEQSTEPGQGPSRGIESPVLGNVKPERNHPRNPKLEISMQRRSLQPTGNRTVTRVSIDFVDKEWVDSQLSLDRHKL